MKKFAKVTVFVGASLSLLALTGCYQADQAYYHAPYGAPRHPGIVSRAYYPGSAAHYSGHPDQDKSGVNYVPSVSSNSSADYGRHVPASGSGAEYGSPESASDAHYG